MVASPSADTKTKPPPSPVPSVGDGIDMEWLFPRVALLGMAAVCGTNFPLVKDLELTHSVCASLEPPSTLVVKHALSPHVCLHNTGYPPIQESSVALVRFSFASASG